jgi:hypothetical protein
LLHVVVVEQPYLYVGRFHARISTLQGTVPVESEGSNLVIIIV